MNFQSLAVQQGELFAKTCILALQAAGFEVAATKIIVEDVGIELDAIANNARGLAFPFEFKGSFQGDRPGLIRTDTVKKAIANAFLFSLSDLATTMSPLVVLTSHKPTSGAGLTMLSRVPRRYLLAVLSVYDDRKQLRDLAQTGEADVKRLLQSEDQQAEATRAHNGYYDCFRQDQFDFDRKGPIQP